MPLPITPPYVPTFSREGESYPAGGDDWASTLLRVEPSAAEQALGATPGQPVDAQTFNYMMGNLAQHVESIVDAPSFTWTPFARYTSADIVAGTSPNYNRKDDQPLLHSAGERLVIQTRGGSAGIGFHSGIVPGHGLGFGSNAGDTAAFYASADSGLVAAGMVLITRRDSNRIVACDRNDGTVKYTDDYGANWSAGGTTVGGGGISCGGYFDGQYHFVQRNGASWEVYSSSTLSGTWAHVTVPITDSPGTEQQIQRFVPGAASALFLPENSVDTPAKILVYSGGTWDVQLVPAGTAPVGGWRGDFNAFTGKFLLTNDAGDFYVSNDGATWGSTGLAFGETVYDVAAHGRGWVISGGAEDFSGPAVFPWLVYLSYNADQDLASNVRKLPLVTPGQFYGRYHLIRHRGRVIAGRAVQSTSEWLEYWSSNVHPATMLSDLGGY